MLLDVRPAGWGALGPNAPGVYPVSTASEILYVGEATWLARRLDQHRARADAELWLAKAARDPDTHRDQLRLRCLEVRLGRLELEETTIATLRPAANTARRSSHAPVEPAESPDLWAQVQSDPWRILRRGVAAMRDWPAEPWPGTPEHAAGVYVVHDADGAFLCVGESDDLAERLATHAAPRSYFFALRRHVGTDRLGFRQIPGRHELVPEAEEPVSRFLERCVVRTLAISLPHQRTARCAMTVSVRPLLVTSSGGACAAPHDHAVAVGR